MNSPFLAGFADELTKTAGVPIVSKIKSGATMLGKKVQSIASSVAKRARGIRAETKGGTGLKGVTKGPPKMPKVATVLSIAKVADAADGDSGDAGDGSADDILKAMIDEAEARINNPENEQGYNDQQGSGADDASYGSGKGMKAPKQPKAPAKPKHGTGYYNPND